VTDDPLIKIREFIARELEGADAWTEVPLVYESGYVSALKVVDKFAKEEDMSREPISPGEFLRDVLADRRWLQKDLSEIIDRPPQSVSEIMNGKKKITHESAIQIGAALGMEAEILLHVQNAHALWHLRRDEAHQKKLHAIRQRAEDKELDNGPEQHGTWDGMPFSE
jgi:addiction module HigA family antidote